MDLSIVTTLFQSAPYVDEFYRRATAAAECLTSDFEIVFVNDGSPDGSLDLAIELVRKDPRVRVIDLSRNFGHHRAIMTGLSHSRGALIFLTDSDLEEAPELLKTFREELRRGRADVVYGVQVQRQGRVFERLSGRVFYWLFNVLSSYPIPPNLVMTRLMTRRYVEALLEHKEREVFLGGLLALTGFRQVAVSVSRVPKGTTTYTLARKIALFVNSITSFSSKPLVFVFYLGCFIIAVSGGEALYLVIRRLFFAKLLGGWPSLMVSLWFLGGLTIFCLGVIGIYLSKIFTEIKQRPYALIARIYEHNQP